MTRVSFLILIVISLCSDMLFADGSSVNKIYHPYVYALEQEVEFQAILQGQDELDDLQNYTLSYGRSLSDRLYLEAGIKATKLKNTEYDVNTVELEAIYQLTEQGEKWADLGLLVELERENERKVNEATVGLLVEKELGDYSVTGNFLLTHESGRGIKEEIETAAALQLRKRHLPWFEPAVELFVGQDTLAVGPQISGIKKLEGKKKVRWETAWLVGAGKSSPDNTMKILLEYEF